MFMNMYALERMARELPEERLQEVENYNRSKQARLGAAKAGQNGARESRSEVASVLGRLLSFRVPRLLRG